MIDLSRISIVASLQIDSEDRVENAERFVDYYGALGRDVEVILVEQAPGDEAAASLDLARHRHVRHHRLTSPECHWATRNRNFGARLATRPCLLHTDVDILALPEAIEEGLRRVEAAPCFVQLLNGVFVDVSADYQRRFPAWKDFLAHLAFFERDHDLRGPPAGADPGLTPLYGDSRYSAKGNCTLCRREDFFLAGGWNENFVSYGFEDIEFLHRVEKLGWPVEQIERCNAYHLHHERGPDSYYNHFYRSNEAELARVQAMSAEALRDYVHQGFRAIELRRDGEYELTNGPTESSWRAVDSRRIPLEDVCIVVPADASVVRYGDSCLPALLYLLERHFRSFEVRLCEVGGRHFEHLETKNNIVYRSVPDGSVSRASRLVEQAASETRRPRLLVVPLTRDAERDFGRARGALDAIRAGKVPPELESREAILATAAGREARTGPRPAQVAESSGPAAASAGPPAIYVAFDDAFAELARTCLASLERNWPDHPVVLVDYAGAGGTDLGWLDARPRVRRLPEVEPPRFTQGLADGPVGSPMVHRRFRLWTPEFDAYGPILHLDVDTLVLGPLAELFESDEFFIVSNHEPTPYVRVFDPIFEHDLTLQRLLAEDGFAYPHAMDDLANAGVFVLPRRLRNEEELARLERIAGRYARYLAYADQSVISLWCAQRGLAFSTDYRFNYQAAFVNDPSVEARLEDARILHFTTHRKPGTPEFARWDRLEGHHARLEALFREYRGLALSGGAAAR